MHDVIIATLTTNPIVGIYSSRSVGASLPSDSRITVGRRAAAQPSTELDLAQNETNSLCCSSLSSVRAGRMLTRNNNDFVRTSAHSIRRTQLMRSDWHLAALAILFSAYFLCRSSSPQLFSAFFLLPPRRSSSPLFLGRSALYSYTNAHVHVNSYRAHKFLCVTLLNWLLIE